MDSPEIGKSSFSIRAVTCPMDKMRIAIAGVGNCAGALLQGMEYHRHN